MKKSDLIYLRSLAGKKEPNIAQINKTIDLYEQRKIARRDTAEIIILKLMNKRKIVQDKALKDLAKYEVAETVKGRLKKEEEDVKLRIQGKKKAEAVELIKQKFRKYNQSKVAYKNLDKALTHVEFRLDHLKENITDYTRFMAKIKPQIINEGQKLMIVKTNVKFALGIKVRFKKMKKDDKKKDVNNLNGGDVFGDDKEEEEVLTGESIVKTKPKPCYSKQRVPSLIEFLIEDLEKHVNAVKLDGSGWSIDKIEYAFLESYNNKPIRGSSYIPTPEKFSHAKCGLINIRNDDNECFKWCMIYHQTKKEKHDDRISVLKKFDDKYDDEKHKFPCSSR